MTIHASVRTVGRSKDELREALGAATSRRGLRALVTALGLFWEPRVVVRGRGGVWSVADHGTMRVLLAEARAAVNARVIGEVTRILRDLDPGRPMLALIASPAYGTLTIACFAPEGDLRYLTMDPLRPLASELDVLHDMVAEPGEPGVALALRYAAALDHAAVSARFFAAVRVQRGLLTDAWKGLPARDRADREQLSLLLLCRLMFLYFLQRQGHLAGDTTYLMRRVRQWQRAGAADVSLYRTFVVPLFFSVLNTRPERRSADALGLGPLPYLNGGLFERHALERRHVNLDLPDHVLVAVFENLLERFRFTVSDSTPDGADGRGIHIDPEMLGRVFEGLMSADRRGETGTFYTPPAIVGRLAGTALAYHLAARAGVSLAAATGVLEHGEVSGLYAGQRVAAAVALREVRVLDPACGSGAFLLGALNCVAAARSALGEDPVLTRRDIVANCLHGVDLLDDAALICSLRLWLALADTSSGAPPPLPNLDRRIRQGDALLDPLQALMQKTGADVDARAVRAAPVRSALKALVPLAAGYVDADPEDRLRMRAELNMRESRLARAWLGALRDRLDAGLRDAVARGGARDLWNEQTTDAHAAHKDMRRLEQRVGEADRLLKALDDDGTLPFFSFRVHFADTPQFDVVLSNPPWIRSHKWPAAMNAAVRESYAVCRSAGWPAAAQYGGARASGQVDLSLLFLERSVGLLKEGGVLAMLLPAKALRSLYAGGARALLARDMSILSIDDYSLDQRSVFRADAFTCAVIARKVVRSAGAGGAGVADVDSRARVQVRMNRRNVPALAFDMNADDLCLIPADASAPWLIAPPDVVAAFRVMQQAGSPLARAAELSVRRGIVTGANDVLIVREFTHRLGGLTHIRAEGYFRARKLSHSTAEARRFVGYVETSAVRPLIRGSDVRAWRARPSARVLFVPANDARGLSCPPRLQAFLKRHDAALRARTGVSPGAPQGCLMRLSDATLGHKVVWHDIAETLHAAAVPATMNDDNGGSVPVLPLNTVYFIAVRDADTAMLLTAYLNSLPLRCFARAAAERAKDARFRFFAWTVGMLPLPRGWRSHHGDALRDIARCAHEAGGITADQQARLDGLVATAYGLADHDVIALHAFDRWLSGVA